MPEKIKYPFFIVLLGLFLSLQTCRTSNLPVGEKKTEALAVSTNNDSMKADSVSACDSALKMIQNIHFDEWNGLPQDCDYSAFIGQYPDNWDEIPFRDLGSNFRRASKIYFELQGYMRPSLAFVDGKAVLFEAMGPKIADLKALLDMLGAPKAKLDWDFGTLPLHETEFVFPDRGITLFLNTDLDKALHIAVYPSTDLENYLQDVRPQLGKKRIDR
jgi:hypothetical protein